MKLKLHLIVLVVFCLLSFHPALARVWTDISGTRKAEAELVKLDGDVVHLKKTDGTVIQVPLDKLSEADREFAQQTAIANYTEAIRLDPKSAEAYFNRGRLYAKKDDDDKAIADYTKATQIKPDYVEAYVRRAGAYLRRGECEKAIADCNEAIQVNPRFAMAYCNRGVVYGNRGEHDKAITDYNEAIRLNPKFALAYHNRGVAYSRMGRLDKAIADYTEAIRLDPKDALAYDTRGQAIMENGDHDKAIADYNEAIRLDPKYAQAYCNRGVAYENKGEHDKAITDYNEAIRLNPKFALAYHNRGLNYMENGDHDKAIADYNEAIRLNPKFAMAYCNRGVVYGNRGEYDKAITDYNEAIRLNPKFALAYHNRGLNYMKKGDPDKAIADYDEAIRLDPKRAIAYSNRGNAYKRKGELEKALADYTEAIRLDPKKARAYYGRGVACGEKGDHDKAIADFTEAIRLDPKDADAYYGRAKVYRQKAEESKAASDLAEAKRLGCTALPSVLLSKQLTGAEPPHIGPLKMDLRPADMNTILSRTLGRKVEDPFKYDNPGWKPEAEGFTDWDRVESLAADGKPLAQEHQNELREFALSNVKPEYGFPVYTSRVCCFFAADRLYKVRLVYEFPVLSEGAAKAAQKTLGVPAAAIPREAAEQAERVLLQQLAAKYKTRTEPFADMIELISAALPDADTAAALRDPERRAAGRKLLIQNGEAPAAVNNMRVINGQLIMPYSYRIHGKVAPDGTYERLFENESCVVAVDSSPWDVISRESDGSVSIARRFVRVTYIWRPFVEQLGSAYTTAKLRELEDLATQPKLKKANTQVSSPPKAATAPTLDKRKQQQLVTAKRKKLEQLQKEQERLQNAPTSGRPSAQQEQGKARRLEQLQSQIEQLQQEIESADHK
jgi:tetratricopeptide (TPR) repeat protein